MLKNNFEILSLKILLGFVKGVFVKKILNLLGLREERLDDVG